MDKSAKEYKEAWMQIGMILVLAVVLILLLSYLLNAKEATATHDDAWAAEFDFSTATPTQALGTEGGWWDDLEEERPDALPTMPGIELYATATPSPIPTGEE